MKFTPKTEKEIEVENLWPEGVYSFEIFKTDDKPSRSGNQMITLSMFIYNENGDKKIVNDYLLEAAAYKLRHAAVTCGLMSHYENGFLACADFEEKTGKVKVGIEKDKSGNYSDKNVIKDYIPSDHQLHKAVSSHNKAKQNAYVATDLNDEVPF